jgi:ABC-type antimicrobial peptide transport system permease subunit
MLWLGVVSFRNNFKKPLLGMIALAMAVVVSSLGLSAVNLMIFALFYLALRERSYELGVMRAIGHSKALMMAVLAGEGLVMAAAAAGLGLAVVWAVCAVVPHLADRFTLALYLLGNRAPHLFPATPTS